jgi:hypothetical protein
MCDRVGNRRETTEQPSETVKRNTRLAVFFW